MTNFCLLFPGQGSQKLGMGRDLAEARASAKDLWLLAERESGQPLREIYWSGSEADMTNTAALQPAISVVNLNLWLEVRANLVPSAVAGHSLGEFTALAAAGVLSVEEIIRAVSLRGKLMSQVGNLGQSMVAVVKLSQAQVENIVERIQAEMGLILHIANYNSPFQFVISGETSALERAWELVRACKGRVIPLSVSGAFHSPLIAEAALEFSHYLGGLNWRVPVFPVFHNATALPEFTSAKICESVKHQMTSPVLWIQTMTNLWSAGCCSFLELGPKGVLSKLVKANLGGLENLKMHSAAGLAEVKTLLQL